MRERGGLEMAEFEKQRIKIIESTSGRREFSIYEEVYDITNKRPTFLEYHTSDLTKKLFERSGDYRTFFTNIDAYDDNKDEKHSIKIIPEDNPNWPLAEYPLPEIMLPENELDQEIYDFLHDHIDLVDPLQYWLLVSWIKATWLTEEWSAVPYIYFLGSKGSGKSIAQKALASLSYHPLLSCNISPSAIFHSIEKWKPTTLFLDEVENWDKEQTQINTGLLNSGYQRGQYAIRMVGEGKNMEPKKFDVFGFKSIAGTTELKDTTMSRCLIINMFRATRKLRLTLDEKRARALRTQLLIWRMASLYNFLQKSEADEADERSEGSEEAEELAQFENGRFIEKFNCLIKATSELKDHLLEYAKKEYDTEIDEEATSQDAEVTDAIDNCRDLIQEFKQIKWLPTREITNYLNQNITRDKDKWDAWFVGRIIKRLGFKLKHTNQGNGIIYNEKLLNYNLIRYHLKPKEDSPPSEPSLPSPTSPASLLIGDIKPKEESSNAQIKKYEYKDLLNGSG